ncbi:MAG: serine/threonine protein kinase [Clostridiales bacterium]|nr:serine/threonine protein kinase [Clostridiales bacterium]
MLETGELVNGRYRILHKIGQGGMSVVYLAKDELENRQWAVKEVRREGVQDFRVVEQGLITETNMLKRLHHPNLPHIVDVIENEDRFLIVMEYIEGISLKDKLAGAGALLQTDVIRWGVQLCDVLDYLHGQRPPIIYRDLKPANIMLKPGGDVKLIDFGTAREYKTGNQEDTINIGTVGYAAPEQYGGMGQSDARTDIYCLGVTLYQLVTGKNPCEPPYLVLPIRHWNPALSPELEQIILKCTEIDPADRYQSAAEVSAALGSIGGAGDRETVKKPGFLEKLLSGGRGKRQKPQPQPVLQPEPPVRQEQVMPMQAEDHFGDDETALLLPKEHVGIGRFIIVRDIMEIHTDEVI